MMDDFYDFDEAAISDEEDEFWEDEEYDNDDDDDEDDDYDNDDDEDFDEDEEDDDDDEDDEDEFWDEDEDNEDNYEEDDDDESEDKYLEDEDEIDVENDDEEYDEILEINTIEEFEEAYSEGRISVEEIKELFDQGEIDKSFILALFIAGIFDSSEKDYFTKNRIIDEEDFIEEEQVKEVREKDTDTDKVCINNKKIIAQNENSIEMDIEKYIAMSNDERDEYLTKTRFDFEKKFKDNCVTKKITSGNSEIEILAHSFVIDPNVSLNYYQIICYVELSKTENEGINPNDSSEWLQVSLNYYDENGNILSHDKESAIAKRNDEMTFELSISFRKSDPAILKIAKTKIVVRD